MATKKKLTQGNGNGAEQLSKDEAKAAHQAFVLPKDPQWFTAIWDMSVADAAKIESGAWTDAQARNMITLRRNLIRNVENKLSLQRLERGLRPTRSLTE